jgi:hypothetical protein
MASRKRVNPRFRIAAIYPSVNLQPLIKIPKIDTQHPAPKNEISKWLVVSRMEKNYNTIYK